MNKLEPVMLNNLERGLKPEELYFKLWEREQEHSKNRWTVTTFFVSISLAVFGLSLQTQNPTVPPIISHAAALAIYWFSVLLFWRFNRFTLYLRSYLQELESLRQVTVEVHTKAYQTVYGNPWLSTFSLLLYFGIFYSTAVGLLWWGSIQ